MEVLFSEKICLRCRGDVEKDTCCCPVSYFMTIKIDKFDKFHIIGSFLKLHFSFPIFGKFQYVR